MQKYLKYIIGIFLIRCWSLLYNSKLRFRNNSVGKIIVIRLDEIGDMVLMTPFFRELRKSYPQAEITLVVKPAVKNLVELCPYIDRVLTYKRPSGKFAWLKNYFSAIKFAKEYLQPLQVDMAIVPRWDCDGYYGAGLLAYLSRASRRIGYSNKVYEKKEINDYGYDAFYTELLYNKELKHEVKRNLYVLEKITEKIVTDTSLEFWLSEDDEKKAKKLLEEHSCQDELRIAIFLSAGTHQKELGVENFVLIVKELEKQYKLKIYLLGDVANTSKYGTEFLLAHPDAVNFIGKTSLRETSAVLKYCDLFLSGDTGPMHLAAAVGCRGVSVFIASAKWQKDGLNTPERFGPWSDRIVCLAPDQPLLGCEHGCYKTYPHCITQISNKDIIKAMEKQINIILEERRRQRKNGKN